MNSQNCVILLTGTINADRQVPFLSISNVTERRKQYLDAITFYITNSAVKKIVFCENSGEKCPDDVKGLAEKYKVDFEWISFNGNTQKTIQYGKSYGESEIIDYAIENSCLLDKVPYFIKITGRVIVKNINVLLSTIGQKRNYFDAYGDNEIEIIDSRLFAVRKDVFSNYFQKEYLTSICEKCNSIERLYPSIIKKCEIEVVSLPIKIWYEGISGGYGVPYVSTAREIITKSITSFILSFGGRRLFLSDVKKWQGDMRLTDEIWNKYFSEFTGKTIAICGMGKIGIRLYTIAELKCLKIYLADSNYKEIRKIKGTKVISYIDVCKKHDDIDHYLICAKNKSNAMDIKKCLLVELKSDHKIAWVMDYINESDIEANFIN